MKALPACLLAALVAGCAQTGALREDAPGFMQAARISPQAAQSGIAPGRSTRAEVAAALGRARVIAFDSGYQVWVYRWPGAEPTTRAATELVVLFDPTGLATKTRIRPGYPPSP